MPFDGDPSDDELVRLFPGEPITHDSAAHYRGRLRRELLVNRCDSGHWHHPPRPLCPSCLSWEVTPTRVSGRGRIHLLTLLRRGPETPGVDYASGYPVVTVELDEQPALRFTSTIVDVAPHDVRLDERVVLAWLERGGVPLPVFVRDVG